MASILQPLSDRTSALAGYAQPVIVALSTAGLTGAIMAAAGMLAGSLIPRMSSGQR